MTSDREYGDREYAQQILSGQRGGNIQSCARRLLAALEREEKLREALFQVCVECGEDMDGARSLSDMGKISPGIDVWAVRAAKQLREDYDEEPHGNFSDTQDTNPEGGC